MAKSEPLDRKLREEMLDIRRDAQIGFRVNSALKTELERLARADRRSLASYLELLLEEHVKKCRNDKASGTKKARRS
jgi:hypothetical protein